MFKWNNAHLTRRLALRTMINFFFKRLKSLSVRANDNGSHFVRTIHVPNKFNNAIVIPKSRRECATPRRCSHYFHTCLLSKDGSCRGGDFRDGQG